MPHGRSPRHVRKAKPKAVARPLASPVGSPVERGIESPRKTAPAPVAPVRLQRLLAGAGFGSRRDVEALVAEGRVSVNGEIAQLGDRARPGKDDIRLDGERVLADRPAYWIVNKPRGVITTVRDESGRRTVLDLLPAKVGRVFPVGRLDVETQGLLLLTNDGETAYAMLHPSLGNEREYRVSVKGAIDAKAIARLEKGVNLEEGRTAPGRVDEIRIDPKTGTSSFLLTLVEGRNRQIRRSLLILGFPVRRLVRERMGPLRLSGLAVGESRPLTPEEQKRLLDHVARLRDAAPAPQPRRTKPVALGMRRGSSALGVSRATGSRGAPSATGSSKSPRTPRPPKAPATRPSGPRQRRSVSSRKGVKK